jgi:hypothetical protein
MTAADLPYGSIVTCRGVTFTKDHLEQIAPWKGDDGSNIGDWLVDEMLIDGDATVLRVGDGA